MSVLAECGRRCGGVSWQRIKRPGGAIEAGGWVQRIRYRCQRMGECKQAWLVRKGKTFHVGFIWGWRSQEQVIPVNA